MIQSLINIIPPYIKLVVRWRNEKSFWLVRYQVDLRGIDTCRSVLLRRFVKIPPSSTYIPYSPKKRVFHFQYSSKLEHFSAIGNNCALGSITTGSGGWLLGRTMLAIVLFVPVLERT
jgi:hypothetical protein